VSSLERRVLVLRSGLGDARAHSRRATARRLGISVERTTRAERRGLRGIARANRATGCGYGGSGGGSAGGSFAQITARAPLVAELLGLSTPAAAGLERARQDEAPAFTDGPAAAADELASAAEGAATAAEDGGAFPFVILLALVAMLLATAAVLGGRRVAGDVLNRRAENAQERRHEELVTAVRNILGERQRR
jgi:hypothetical protein